MRADCTITRTVENNFATNEHDNCDLDQSVYSEIDEEVQLHRQEAHNNNNSRSLHTQTDMYEPYEYGQSHMGASSSFFSRHPARAPGQTPLWGYHQLHYQADPNAGNVPLYARGRGAQVARHVRVYQGSRAATGGRGARGGRGRVRKARSSPPSSTNSSTGSTSRRQSAGRKCTSSGATRKPTG